MPTSRPILTSIRVNLCLFVVVSSVAPALAHAASIGGRVLEDDGSPIPNARILIHIDPAPAATQPATQPTPDRWTTSDQNGHWHLDNVPQNAAALLVSAFHPAYELPDQLTPARTLKADLFANDQTLHLAKADQLTLTLTSADGRPLPGALISRVAPPNTPPAQLVPPVPAGADGKILLGLPHNAVLLLQAPHCAPTLLRLPADIPATLAVTLKPGNPLVARLADPAGKAISGATVTPIAWPAAGGEIALAVRFTTNAKGEFEWDDAPDDPLTFRLDAPGFLTATAIFKPRADNHAALTRQAPITLTLEDSGTHAPIPAAVITELPAPDSPPPDPANLRALGKGRFELLETTARAPVTLHAAATDYLPADTAPIPLDGKPHDLTLSLKKGQSLAAILVDAAGHPLPKTTLRLLPENEAAHPIQSLDDLLSPAAQKAAPDQFTTTDDVGHFAFPAQTGHPLLLTQTPAGYLLTTTIAGTLRLQEWARVEGTLRQGENLAAAGTWVTLRTQPSEAAPLSISAAARTDAAGHFSFDHVPAGPAILTAPDAAPRPLTATPGKPLTLDLGSAGHAIVGRLQLPPDVANQPWITAAPPTIETLIPLPDLQLPADFAKRSSKDQTAFYDAWRASPAGKSFLAAQAAAADIRKQFTLSLRPDATFRIEALPPGTYQLLIPFKKGSNIFSTTQPAPAAAPLLTAYTLTIPAASPSTQSSVLSTQSSVPSTQSSLSPHAQYDHLLHHPAPDLFFTRLDGKPLTLSSFKGKTVLLAFWSSTSPESLAQNPILKHFFDTVGPSAGRKSNLEIIGLSSDPDAAATKSFVAAHDMPWTQATLGPLEKPFQASLYQVTQLPTYALISPTGDLLALTHTPADLEPLLQNP